MRLYLASYKDIGFPDRLIRLVGDNKRVAIIMNATDGLDPEGQRVRLETEKAHMKAIGFEPDQLDLRDYFGKTDDLRERMAAYGLFWARGGNSFVLMRAMVESGFDVLIKELLKDDVTVYGGFSAGAVCATPTLRGIDLVDDPRVVPDGYASEPVWEGLGLVGYTIAPHYKSEHPESAMIDKTVEYYERENMEYRAMRDGEVIVVDGEGEEWLGKKE